MKAYNTFQHGPRAGEPRTLTDRVIRFLTESTQYNATEVPSRSRYRQFLVNGPRYFFVGSAASVRTGKNASNSRSITDLIHLEMEIWERDIHKDFT